MGGIFGIPNFVKILPLKNLAKLHYFSQKPKKSEKFTLNYLDLAIIKRNNETKRSTNS